MKFVLNRRVRGRRVVFVLLSRPERRPVGAVATTGMAAVTAGGAYLLHRVGRRSGVTSEEAAAPLPGPAT